MKSAQSKSIQVSLALLTVQVLFGVNYVISKSLVEAFPPLIWASLRVVVSSFFLFFIAYFSGQKHPKPDRRFFVPVMIYSILGITLNQSAFLVGLRYTTATNSAILNTLIPLFTLIFVTALGQERLTQKRVLGFLLAMIGVLIIRKVETFSLSDQNFLGDFLTIFNCFSCGLFFALSKKFFETYRSLWSTFWLFSFGSIGLTFLSAYQWNQFQVPPLDSKIIGAMIFSIFGSTLLAYVLNLWALARTRSSSVALYIYLQPILASSLAWVTLGETPTLRTAISCLFIFGGVGLASFSRRPTHTIRKKLAKASRTTAR